jgi:hypothetical protein
MPPGTIAMPPPVFDLEALRARNASRATPAGRGSSD